MTGVASETASNGNPPQIKAESSRASIAGMVFACATLVVFADFLFFEQTPGWTVGLFLAAVIIPAFGLWPSRVRTRMGFILFALLLGLALAFVESPTILAGALTAGVLSALLVEGSTSRVRGTGDALWAFLASPITIATAGAQDFRLAARAVQSKDRQTFSVWNWVVPVLLTAVFIVLFASANPLIETWIAALDIHWRPNTPRLTFWLAVSGLIWSVFRTPATLPPYQEPSGEDISVAGPGTPASLPRSTSASAAWDEDLILKLFSTPAMLRSLVLFNAVFALQNALDAAFLWGGKVLPPGFTYAQYAHRGAYPLIITALLAGAFVLAALRRGSGIEDNRWIWRLIVLWLAQNVFLVSSALLRTKAYVDEYSLTHLRLFAFLWMGLVAWGLILIAVRMALGRPNAWLVRANAISIFALFYVSAFLDYSRIIADFNVAHAFEMSGRGKSLDVRYLVSLGVSALPALETYREKVSYPPAKPAPDLTSKRYFVPNDELELYRALWKNEADWRSWTFRRSRLRNAVPFEWDTVRSSDAR